MSYVTYIHEEKKKKYYQAVEESAQWIMASQKIHSKIYLKRIAIGNERNNMKMNYRTSLNLIEVFMEIRVGPFINDLCLIYLF